MDTTPTTVTATFPRFPASRVAAAKEALDKAWARVARSAAKRGGEAVNPPTLVAGPVYIGVVERADGHKYNREFVDLELSTASPKVDGYEFLAVIEPMVGGNLVNRVPGSSMDVNLDTYRTGDADFCDHCKTSRKRNETFVVAGPTGLLVVGRDCLADFLGGKSPAHILFLLIAPKLVSDAGEGDGGHADAVFEPATVLAWTFGVIREDGWVSGAKARETEGLSSTANTVRELLSAPPTHPTARANWEKARAACKPTEEESGFAAAALAWAKDLTGSDYASNLSLVAAQPVVLGKHFGLLCSAAASWEREMGKALAAKSAAPSVFVGTVGAKLEVTVTVERVVDLDGNYGVSHLHSMKDAAGNVYVWVTGSVRMPVGKTVNLKGTVKRHTDYKGLAQTELTRCTEIDTEVLVAREVVAKAKKTRKSATV